MAKLTETVLTYRLDRDGQLDRARQPGCYALQLREPSSDISMLVVEWDSEFEAPPPDGFLDRLAEAERFVYVGSHGKSMYTRICQHANGEKSSTIMDIWPPVTIVGIWPEEHPAAQEWNHAVELADDNTVAWTDGSFI